MPREPDIGRGIEWRPNLVLVDVRHLDLSSGFAVVGELRRAGLRVCVIDVADDAVRQSAWRGAGASALVDGSEPFDQLFRPSPTPSNRSDTAGGKAVTEDFWVDPRRRRAAGAGSPAFHCTDRT